MRKIKALWKGDMPLITTFWTYGVVVIFFFKVITLLELGLIEEGFYLKNIYGFVALIATITLFLLYSIFIYVCIWRSANKFEGYILWATLSKFSVIFGVMGWLRELEEFIDLLNL